MSIYQRYLSKSLIFISILFVIFLLFIESNIGFKWFFNFTSRFFIGLKAEEISGNWRDFTLKNIKYNIFGISMTANSLHVILDTKSLFKISTIFKEIETKNLIISLKNNVSSNFSNKNISSNIVKKNIFINYPIIFKKIHADKISFKSPEVHIFCLNFFSSIELINNNIIFSPTYVDAIYLSSLKVNFKKKNTIKKINFIKKSNNIKKIYSFLRFFSNKTKNFVPLNINLMSLKCNKIKFIDYKKNNIFKIDLKAKIENNILKIKKIKVNSSFLKINSYGKVFFNNDHSILFLMNNSIVVPRFQNRIMNFLFKAHLNKNNKLTFRLKSEDLNNIRIYGSVFLNILDYPFFIKLKSKNLFWSIKKDYILKLNNFDGIIKGKINNYFLSLKNIFTLQGLPSILINIKGKGNLKNIFLKNIKILPIKKIKPYKIKIHSNNNIIYDQHILKLMGKINITGKNNDNTNNLSIPKINLDNSIMKKKLSIFSPLYYKKFNFIEIPGINLFLGKNQLYFKGSLGEKYNIHSSIYANNLNYFLPNLKGRIKAKVNFYGDYLLPTITSKILASDLDWKNIYSKNIKILTKMNINNKFLGKILINAKKMRFYDFYINNLHIQTHFNNQKQKFSLLLKSHKLYINLIINGSFNKKTGNWHGFFKKINIQTCLGEITAKKNNLIYYDPNNNISNFYQKNIKKINVILSFLYNTKKSFFNIFNQSLISFKSELFINAKLKWILGKRISDGKIILTSNNIKLEKKINKKFLIENLDYLKISINLIKNDFKSKWIVKKIRNLLNDQSIIGNLNIIDIYNKKNVKGKFIIYNFPFSFINFFTTNFKQVNGTFQSNIKFFGTLNRPKISADVSLKNIFIKSNNLLKYITLFFPYFLGKIDSIKIMQEIRLDNGSVLFTLNPFSKSSDNIEWRLIFNSKKILVSIFPKIRIKFSSQLNLHYLLSKYDLIGYIRFSLFYFKINEKNFIF
ncbi:translocation/assembly module TamB [Buchnera aphidicola (Acyrthosiphon lactucae)]|uniref:Translocation/assembly module TamB n=1 Tax=Buchnera aphidicola (Acyrthosiphon lactucae) TaxID=1241832 RepID=A0A4D6XPR0_9GAMM|nr:translocation/assembly module TamB domain-containing protein [Buchnera aphidicola]QCI17499.1 translocation/assembly module TamB [Buchnera aphidicola (Acyrthosiphon lactucae)]